MDNDTIKEDLADKVRFAFEEMMRAQFLMEVAEGANKYSLDLMNQSKLAYQRAKKNYQYVKSICEQITGEVYEEDGKKRI